MPDHFHVLLFVTQPMRRHLGEVIQAIKSASTSKIRTKLNNKDLTVFEEGFNDRIITSRGQLDTVYNYINQNPYRLAVRLAFPNFFQRINRLKIGNNYYQSVPLFVMASSFLLVPLTTGATTFFKRRFSRVLVPFIVWSLLYAVVPVLTGSISGDIWQRVTTIHYTANIDSGHLWFIYMLIGVYLVMPVISPWINQVSKRGEEMFLAIWFLSTFTGYMMHIFILGFMQQWIAPHFPTLPAILLVGTATFLACILVTRLISLIPFSKWIIG